MRKVLNQVTANELWPKIICSLSSEQQKTRKTNDTGTHKRITEAATDNTKQQTCRGMDTNRQDSATGATQTAPTREYGDNRSWRNRNAESTGQQPQANVSTNRELSRELHYGTTTNTERNLLLHWKWSAEATTNETSRRFAVRDRRQCNQTEDRVRTK